MLRAFEIELPGAARRLAVRWSVTCLLVLAAIVLPGAGKGLTAARAAIQAPSGCRGVTLAVIPAQGAVSNSARTEGGRLWWRDAGGGRACIGTVIEDVVFTAAAPSRWLRVVVFDSADPGGLTVARQQVTAPAGTVSRAFGIHEVFSGLTAVCLAATSPVVPSPDLPCVDFGSPPPTQQFAQEPAGFRQLPLPAQQVSLPSVALAWPPASADPVG